MRPECTSQRFVYDEIYEGCKKAGAAENVCDFAATDGVARFCENRFDTVHDMIDEQIKMVEDFYAKAK